MIDVKAFRERVRASADAAAALSREQSERGFTEDALFAGGRQAAFVTVLNLLDEAEEEAFVERDRALRSVNLAAVEELEEFARHAGGAVDMASGTVYSDADGGL